MDEPKKIPETVPAKVVNIPAPEVIWSMAVKSRDGDRCVACESTDELAVRLMDGFTKIVDEEGRLRLDAGVTLCAKCNLKASTDEEFRAKLPEYLVYHKTTRLNVEIDRDLYSKFVAVCRYRGTTISRAVREFVSAQMSEVEDVEPS